MEVYDFSVKRLLLFEKQTHGRYCSALGLGIFHIIKPSFLAFLRAMLIGFDKQKDHLLP